MEFTVLGNVDAAVDGVSVRLTRGSMELLAILLARLGGVVSREVLADALWEDELPGNPHAALQTQVSRLRDVLEPGRERGVAGGVVVTHQSGYSLEVDPEAVDAVRFRRLVGEAVGLVGSDPAGAVGRCREALGLWRGPAFGEFAERGFAVGEALGLTELRGVAEETLIRGEVASGRHREAVGEIEALLGVDPLREVLWGQLMLAQYRSGNQVEALRAFRRARTVLVDELGLEPTRALQELEEAILLQDPSLDVGSTLPSPVAGGRFGASPVAGGRVGVSPVAGGRDVLVGVPVPIGSFVGREGQVGAVNAAVDANRLVTLVGPGGLGKSRLAIEAVRARSGDEFDVVGFVRLDDLSDPNDVPTAVLDALGVGRRSSDSSTAESDVVTFLYPRRCLLILDGCETVLDAAAGFVRHVLERCVGVRVLATSRQRLQIHGELVWSVPFLQILDLRSETEVTSEAADLFLDRWGGPGWSELDDQTVATVSRLVADLDGLPLAIELVAAGSQSLALADIVAGIDQLLASESDLTAPLHLQSLQASLDWSWNGLGDHQRDVVAQLAVFEEHWNLEAAAAVCGLDGTAAAARLMAELADRSMIMPEHHDGGPSGWYRMTHIQHAYARQKLADSGRADDMLRLHADYFARRFSGIGAIGGSLPVGLDTVNRNRKNLDTALRWSLEHEPGLALTMASSLAYTWLINGEQEQGIEPLELALDANLEISGARAEALMWWAALAVPRTLLRRPTVTFNHPFGRWAPNLPESHSQRLVRAERCVARVEEAIEIGRQVDVSNVFFGMLLTICARVYGVSGRYDEAAASLAEAQAISDPGDTPLRALVLISKADLDLARGDLDQARAAGAEALTCARLSGWALEVRAFEVLTRIARAAGDVAGAYQTLIDAVGLMPPEFELGEAVVQTELGRLAVDLRQTDLARRHFGAALSATRRSGNDHWTAVVRENQAYLEFLEGRFDAAIEYVEIAVSIHHAHHDQVMLAWSQAVLGAIANERGELRDAARHFRECLVLWNEQSESNVYALEGLALIAVADGDDSYAARLFGAAAAERARISFPEATSRLVPERRAEVRGRLGDEEMDRLSAAPSDDQRRRLINRIIESEPLTQD